MIGRLNGILVEKQPPEILLEVSGVGYEVQMPMTCFYDLPKVGENAIVYTHFVVREDAQLLFGFNNKTERALFRELLKANGVGPKLGLAILSGMSAQQFVSCVNNEDATSLVKLPGVGKKTAERLVLEMKDRLKDWGNDLFTPFSDSAVIEPHSDTLVANNAADDAVSALVALGYKLPQAQKAVKSVSKPDMSTEVLIKESLKSML
ncbi:MULTISPECIES: Holliday junction branch migration protein RuvA [unclassified Pseudoalteromonas]|jgi:Holliday junction DNA helicase RuvA|uniref:Holliday junction branch migration protein RuvA n=1 Tax=unclassified Pseudoalteromonas TaxID=194690 RepID=UPI0011096D23|nr:MULTISPECIES: Holliday junction branch migration protein RuvA [unclassified Pseudoalteromonas]MBW4968186.1 Holliday junction branch migration protein RuvA [Pseudoalteromonas sp. CR1]TMN78591.1 Holliday junction branch migration protein RuvA [Pseudoalteromonas sp. S410]TMN88199.1 Holliday junction branch migration protein RuvA [Pseudoalteromonas sp. S408]TMN96602.1 Holliday junction branch migration protein RuvA [Pseudoalteromonas sp. S407]TMO01486.1 Holliday junction branch migration protei|tara:strand:+ start:41 stop:658 length:618 start_codon:yes stop_codon:yes gene_type:complete